MRPDRKNGVYPAVSLSEPQVGLLGSHPLIRPVFKRTTQKRDNRVVNPVSGGSSNTTIDGWMIRWPQPEEQNWGPHLNITTCRTMKYFLENVPSVQGRSKEKPFNSWEAKRRNFLFTLLQNRKVKGPIFFFILFLLLSVLPFLSALFLFFDRICEGQLYLSNPLRLQPNENYWEIVKELNLSNMDRVSSIKCTSTSGWTR